MNINFTLKHNNSLYFCIAICLFINSIFFLTSLDSNWASDDFSYVFGTKLYNLTNDQHFFLFETDTSRFRPLYWFIVQLIPENYHLWKLIVLFVYFGSAVLIFILCNKLTSNSKVSTLASILFTLNYSLSIKALSWGVFFGHIFNIFLGLIGTIILINNIKHLSKFKTSIFFLVNFANFLITEGAAIYLIINLLIIFFHKISLLNKFKLTVINFLPMIIFFVCTFLSSGEFNKILKERVMQPNKDHYSKIFTNDTSREDLYFYRSPYAPRDFKGFSIRLVENMAGSLNLSSIEHFLNSIDQNKKINSYLKENLKLIIFIFLFLLLLILISLYFALKKEIFLKEYKFFISLFFLTLIIYTFVYYRKDINLALSLSSALLLSKILVDCYEKGKKNISKILLILFVTPSILYASSGFSLYSQFNSIENNQKFHEYKIKSKKQINMQDLNKDKHLKFYYLFINFNEYRKNLQALNENRLLSFLGKVHNM